MRTNPIRFTGMASGMDTDSIVKDMLRPQQYKIDNQKKAQALLKLKQDAWKDMNKKLYDFHTKFTDKLRQGSEFNKKITSSSNENAISIDKNANVPTGTHTFVVEKLAESALAVGKVTGDKVSTGGKLDITVNNNGKEKIIEVGVEAGDSFADISSKLSKQLENTGFTAKFDKKNSAFFIGSTATGENQSIQIAGDGELIKHLGFATDDKKPWRGGNAKYSYNGVEGFESETNNIEINGIKATLKSDGAEPITITSQQDPDAVYDFVKEFINEYNKLIDEINLKIGTKPGKDIKPLTAEERKGMSDSEIELWEEKINNSLFYKDTQLTEFVDSARRILGQVLGTVDKDGNKNEYRSLADLGIVTGTWDERGKLYIEGDEDSGIHSSKKNKLKEAIEADSSGVIDFFKKIGTELYQEHNKKLTASNELKSAMNFYNDKVMTKEMQRFDKEIGTLEDRLYRLEEMHYRKFAAMEKLLSSLNNQSSWLAQQFGGY